MVTSPVLTLARTCVCGWTWVRGLDWLALVYVAWTWLALVYVAWTWLALGMHLTCTWLAMTCTVLGTSRGRHADLTRISRGLHAVPFLSALFPFSALSPRRSSHSVPFPVGALPFQHRPSRLLVMVTSSCPARVRRP
jgi:hypothetical protein